MRIIDSMTILLLLLSVWVTLLTSERALTTDTIKLAIPAYFPPGPLWSQALDASPAVGMMVMNPHSGPGSSRDVGYVSLLQAARSKGIRVLGYVPTTWANGTISAAQAKNWISQYYAWYRIDGIFFDEANDTCAKASVDYYTSLYQFVKTKPGSALVVLNPGKSTGECYTAISDIILTFEGTYDDYLRLGSNASASPKQPNPHLWHIVYSAHDIYAMQRALTLARELGAGWIYITDKAADLGLSTLPGYFSEEVSAISLG